MGQQKHHIWRYKDDYEKRWAAYKEAFNSLTDSQREEIKKQKEMKKIQKRKKLLKKIVKKLNKPKRPPAANILYLMERYSSIPHGSSVEKTTLIGKEWSSLSPEEQQPYKTRYQYLRQTYDQELTMWEDKMWEAGHPQFIRGYSKEVKHANMLTKAKKYGKTTARGTSLKQSESKTGKKTNRKKLKVLQTEE